MNANTLNVRTSNSANLPAVFAILSGFLKTDVVEGWTWADAIEEANNRGTIVDLDETPLGRFLNSEVSKGWTWGMAIDEALESGAAISFPAEAYGEFLANEQANEADEGIDGETLKFWLRDLRADAALDGKRRTVTLH